ncbi:MAG: hypothetical protein GXW99_04460 [Clostridiales bacterium]|nr:hypothetical protein [Clostridiales bacterium]
MSTIVCIIDGMTDTAFRPEDYPTLSSFSYQGAMQPTPAGYGAESLTCILTILGVKKIPRLLRGYADALGAGIPVEVGDLVTRVSWMALDETGRCTLPINASSLAHTPNGCTYYALGGYKGLLVLEGQGSCAEHITAMPPYQCAGNFPAALRPTGCEPLSAFFDQNLTTSHCAVPWGQAAAANLPPFVQKAAVICGTQIVRGIASLLHMDCPVIPGATGDTDTDLRAKTEAALQAAETYPFVLLHFNGSDEASHRKDAAEKRAFIHRVDDLVLPHLYNCPHRVYVLSDHATDPQTGCHVGTPQPVFMKEANDSCGRKESSFFSAFGL